MSFRRWQVSLTPRPTERMNERTRGRPINRSIKSCHVIAPLRPVRALTLSVDHRRSVLRVNQVDTCGSFAYQPTWMSSYRIPRSTYSLQLLLSATPGNMMRNGPATIHGQETKRQTPTTSTLTTPTGVSCDRLSTTRPFGSFRVRRLSTQCAT